MAAALANATSRETSDEVRALAAAEVVAAASGHAGGRIPVEAVELAARLGRPTPAILSEARSVAEGLLGDSELRVLFEDDPEWLGEMEDLTARLSKALYAAWNAASPVTGVEAPAIVRRRPGSALPKRLNPS